MKIKGNLIIEKEDKNDYSALTEVSGYVDVRQNAQFTAPALTKSGSVYVQENAQFTAPALKIKNNIATIAKKKYDIVHKDGIAFYVVSSKTTKEIKVYSGFFEPKIENKKLVWKDSFLAVKGNFSAHGETLKKAVDDLQFKITAEKLKKEPIYMETVMTDNYYRLTTGACEIGVKRWKENNNIKVESMTVKELLPLLQKTNAYGYEKLKSLVKN